MNRFIRGLQLLVLVAGVTVCATAIAAVRRYGCQPEPLPDWLENAPVLFTSLEGAVLMILAGILAIGLSLFGKYIGALGCIGISLGIMLLRTGLNTCCFPG